MNKLLKEKKWVILRKFSKCFRYIDDLLAINNDNFMEKWKNKIYPSELLLTSDDKMRSGSSFFRFTLRNPKINNSIIAYLTNAIIFTFLLLTFHV